MKKYLAGLVALAVLVVAFWQPVIAQSPAVQSVRAALGAFVDGWDATQGSKADSVCGTATGACSVVALIKYLNTQAGTPLPAQSTHTVNIGAVDSINEYPGTAVPYTASTTGTTGATTATLAGAASVTTYICGMSVRSNATAAATGNITVTGTISATMNFTHWTAPLASGIGITEMIFKPCVPASAANQSVAVVSPAPGSGGTISVTAWGYKL